MAFRDERQQQAAIVANQSETMFAAYWPHGRARHASLSKCIAVLEALGFAIEVDMFTA